VVFTGKNMWRACQYLSKNPYQVLFPNLVFDNPIQSKTPVTSSLEKATAVVRLLVSGALSWLCALT